MKYPKVTVIGAAIIDVLAGPFESDRLSLGSVPMDRITMDFGGDGLNEAVDMKRLGLEVNLITKIGSDEAGEKVLSFLQKNGVDCIANQTDGLDTGINIVLVDSEGQRTFLTNPKGSLRMLSVEDIFPYIEEMGDIVCFGSMFVSPLLDIPAMERLFKRIKEKPGRILVADMTLAKNKETLDDIKGLLKYIDYLIPNEKEAALLTGIDDPFENARLFAKNGVGCVVIKAGKDGCIIFKDDNIYNIKPMACRVVDTTGAGDGFVAGFVYALSRGMSITECGRFGNAAASCVIEEYGAHMGLKSLEAPLKRFENNV